MAIVPTLLYYLSIILMIEADSRRMRTQPVEFKTEPLWELTRKFGYHFSSLFAVAILMGFGMTPFHGGLLVDRRRLLPELPRPEIRLSSL
jgi:hypothetical protein